MAKKPWKNDLGEKIKAARERSGVSRERLAEIVHIKRGSLYLYEAGKGNPRFKVVAEIAAALKADFEVLGCRVIAAELLEPSKPQTGEQLELAYDQNHSFLANVTIRPTKKSITITTHHDYGIKSA